MTAEAIRYVRDHLSEIVDQVEAEQARVEITRNGRVVAILMSAEEVSVREETLRIMSDPVALADIGEADLAHSSGDVVVGVDVSVPSGPEPFELVVTPPARRAIESELTDAVAHAVIQLITGSLVRDPHRVGKQLRRELAGLWVARRGSYRVVYRIDESRRVVVVIRIDHRSDLYRPL